MQRFFLVLPLLFGVSGSPLPLEAASGTEGAGFLEIPVGAGPASVGGAYTALASNAYAPTWNPAGLGFLRSSEVAAMHVSYLESISYEFASAVHPLSPYKAMGASLQYLRPGDLAGTDLQANPIGNVGGQYTASSLSYGQSVHPSLAFGLTAKWIKARIDDVSASAWAFDVGSMWKVNKQWTLAGVLANAGTNLTFINQADSLPLAFRTGGLYKVNRHWQCMAEGVYRKTGLASFHTGVEWSPLSVFSLRAGHRTDTVKELSTLAGGFTAGLGVHLWGHEFAYAWNPYGTFGQSQYFSMVLKFGKQGRKEGNPVLSNPADAWDDKDRLNL